MREGRRMAKWSRQRIITEILRRDAEGLPLASSAAIGGVHYTLYSAASRIFGSWQNAVVAAGLPPSRSRVTGEWTPGRVRRAIRALARSRRQIDHDEFVKRYGTMI